MESTLDTLYDNITAMLSAKECEPVLHKDEMYITFRADESKFQIIKTAVAEEVKLLYPKEKCSSQRAKVRRNGDKCTVLFLG